MRRATEPFITHWAVLGKRPGEAMGYEVLGGSLPSERAGRWLWGAQTGTPSVRQHAGPGELPWRVFLSGVDGEASAACAMVEHDWDGSLDGTGAPIITSRLLLLDWAQASGAGLTWSTLGDAADAVPWPRHQQNTPLSLPLVPASAEALATAVTDLGFDWAATVAALLLGGHLVVVTPAGRPLPPPDERVRLVDAIAALLPYGCRRWLSAATWSGAAEHQLTLSFAESARSAQTEVRYGEAVPASLAEAGAGQYLGELRRLRHKGFSTTDLVRHLLAAREPLRWRDSAGAFRALREVDLLDSVVAEVRAGGGRVEDVGRALALPRPAVLDPGRASVLLRFLCRAATPGAAPATTGGEDGRAAELLGRHWREELPRWVAADVLAEAATTADHDRALACLTLMRTLRGPGSPAFTGLLDALLDSTANGAPGERHDAWRGALAWRAQRAFGAEATSADRSLVEHPEVGRAWARTALDHGPFDPDALSRLLVQAQHLPLRQSTGWLRYAAYLSALPGAGDPSPGDAEDFARTGGGQRWRQILALAAANRRPAVLQSLWPMFWEVAVSSQGQLLAVQLAQLDGPVRAAAPHGDEAGLSADLDLIRLVADRRRAGAPLAALGRRLAHPDPLDEDWTDRYARALEQRLALLPDEIPAAVVDALLGDRPDPGRWRVLERILARQVRTEAALVRALARRLQTGDRRWLTPAVPRGALAALAALPDLHWIAAATTLTGLLHGEPDPRRLGEALATAAGSGPLPSALTEEVLPVLARWPAAQLDRLAQELWHRSPHLATQLYQHIADRTDTAPLRAELVRYSERELQRLDRALWALGYGTRQPRTGGGGAAPPPPGARDGGWRGLLPGRRGKEQ
ncbi:hypothetical protein OG455_32180 [Kitasatospora sp. NBC_01287]|uniref:hypothetical protein n=1 Tax=Kitasatospora sp. NBC_01287 TaxID=2903573 RepID=UPI002252383F|nr:hypothetical protein [Kitasatospora sp. NBC_01287]MCX4750121.1 hypothetical protein [Kitasatospora sp. NBC_01287]